MSRLLTFTVKVRARPSDAHDLRMILTRALNKHGYTQHAVMDSESNNPERFIKGDMENNTGHY